MSSIVMKGTKDGLVIYINSSERQIVLNEILNKLDNAKEFFRGSTIKLVDKLNTLDDDFIKQLQDILKEKYNINVYCDFKKQKEENEKVFSGIYEGRTKFVKNTVRSGQRITYNGNVVIIGDVNSGAEIIAYGNVIVLGVLRGGCSRRS
ncbi:hypothetical protein TCEA9_23510 [Thermobrachium celere]|nr:hypothetical protein TCEA9_23510 [Thermobrachium celere]